MQIANKILTIVSVQLQFRFDSLQVGGLLIQVQETIEQFNISDLDIVGYNLQDDSQSSNLINQINDTIIQSVNISKMKICTNIQYLINSGNASLVSFTEQPDYSCDNICGQQIPVYGLCQINLINGYYNNINQTKYCVYPFIYNGYDCICTPGYLLNATLCIHILSTLTNLDQNILSNISTLDQNIQSNIQNIQNQLVTTKDYLYNYFTNEIGNLSKYVNTTFDDIYNKHNQFELIASQNISSLQIQTNNLQSNITAHNIITGQLRTDLQSVNYSLNNQIQSVSTNLQSINSSLLSQNTEIQHLTSQFGVFQSVVINNNSMQDTQIQNLITFTNSQKIVTDSLKSNLTSLSSQFTSFMSDAISNNTQFNTQIQNLVIITNSQKLDSDQLRADLTSLTTSLQTQINTNQASISQLTAQFTTLKSDIISQNSQFNTQIQSITTTVNSQKLVTDSLRTDFTQQTNSLQTQINSLNSNLKNNLTSLQSQINSINNVNNAQNIEITNLKNKGSLSPAYICSQVYKGYCPDISKCCIEDFDYFAQYDCIGIIDLVPIEKCGTWTAPE
ncbi:Hypothetical_protein [Hexamita inflata]|uniref:Hypothetical_protein n=1 Tax=Hexamita inflata TaxID=28002 RepID=A0ABP1HIH9_9EUKA